MNRLSRVDEEYDGVDVNDQDVQRLVIVTQVRQIPLLTFYVGPLRFHYYSLFKGIVVHYYCNKFWEYSCLI